MKILFYDTKPYDREAFEKHAGKYPDIEIDYLKTDISYRTAPLSKGYDAVCLFVASDVGRRVVDILAENGVRLILMRCADITMSIFRRRRSTTSPLCVCRDIHRKQ